MDYLNNLTNLDIFLVHAAFETLTSLSLLVFIDVLANNADLKFVSGIFTT